MTRPTPISYHGALVLHAVARGHAYGFDIMRVAALPSGTVYPLLRRLEAGGLVRSQWEDEGDAHAHGRPARRHYALTALGEAGLVEAREKVLQQRRLFDAGAGEDSGVPVTG